MIMFQKVDLKDKKILFELDSNCRQSNQQIAKKVGLSKDAIAYRINKLEEQNVIKGYRTIINFQKLGFTQYRVLLNLVNINKIKQTEFIEFLKKEKRVWGIALNEGIGDLAFTCLVKNKLEFYYFYEGLKNKFKKNIKESLISEILKYQEFSRRYILESKSKNQQKTILETEKNSIDKIDEQILFELSNNARVKLITIAKKTKLSSMLIHQRIKKLEQKKIIEGYRANIHVMAFGRDYYGIKMSLDNYSEKNKIIQYIQEIPEMTAILWTLAGFDIEFDLEVKGTKQYQEIINNLRNKFDSIREIKFIRAIEYFKLNHFPKLT